MTNEKLYTVTVIYTCKSTIYRHTLDTYSRDYVFAGYSGLKKALNFIAENYIGKRDNHFYTVSYVKVSETLILR